MLSTKLALRLALHWQDVWETHCRPAPAIDNDWNRLATRFEIAQRVCRRLGIVRNGQFPVGVRMLGKDFAYHLGELAFTAGRLREDIRDQPPPPADLASWLADVRQLEDEFGGIEVRWRERVARIVTEPITLRGIELGPFAIDFHWDRLGASKGVNCFCLGSA